MTTQEPSSSQYIGVHLRRGDRRAVSWRYHGGYVPISEYSQAVQDTLLRLSRGEPTPVIYIASDSPSAEVELVDALPSNIPLFSLTRSRNPDLRALASPNEYVQAEFDKLQLDERAILTRGMVVDFAMLNGMWAWADDITPRATVCTISSSVCRLSAIGLGWDRGFGIVKKMGEIDDNAKGWVEIDNASGIDPSWEAFELFN